MKQDELFTEAALTDSVIYKSFNNNSEMTSTIINGIKESIKITPDYIQEQLMQIKRTRISPLSDEVLSAYNSGKITLLYSENKKIPQALPFFATKVQGKVTVFIFVNNYATIAKSEINSSDKYLNITMKDLYVLMEGAYTALKYNTFPVNITKNLGLMKLSANIYANMIIRILNKEYAISMDQGLYDKVVFSVAYFFLKYVWMSKNESLNLSYACSCIKNAVNRAEMVTIAEQMDDLEVDDINKLMVFLKEMSSRLKSLNFRYFLQCFINTYKPAAMFGLECLPYFLFSIQSSAIGSFIVNQPMISDITKNIKGMNTFYPELVKAIG